MNENKQPPVFIIGVARSGTTLLSLMLDTHPRIAIPNESHFITEIYKKPSLWQNLESLQNRELLVKKILESKYVREWDVQLKQEDINLDRCTTFANTINEVFSAYARAHQKDIWGDKTPKYLFDIDILNKLFPDARYIHIIRDGRDVALSFIRQWFGPNDFVSAMKFWERNVTFIRKMLNMLPDSQVMEIRFEDLVEKPREKLEAITNFLNLPFYDNMISGYRKKAAQKVGERIDAHHANLSKPPSAEQSFKWKKNLSKADQAIAYEIAGPLLEELGYEPGNKYHRMKFIRKGYHPIYEAVYWRFTAKKDKV